LNCGEELQRKSQQLKLCENEKYRILKQSKIFVFPSYLESFGQAMCEAMACKLPVVAYELPTYKEWYGNTMYTVPLGDVSSLEDATLSLLKDKKLREEIGNKGMKVVKKYSWQKVARYEWEIISRNLGIT